MHSQTRVPVTPQEKKNRAEKIADSLCDHSRWLTHGRSIKIEHLRDMGLLIVDYSQQKDLCDAIRRYHVLLQMTFNGPAYKIFETPSSQIIRHVISGQPQSCSALKLLPPRPLAPHLTSARHTLFALEPLIART